MKARNYHCWPWLGLLVAVLSIQELCAAELGMKAPPLQLNEWVQGPPVPLGAETTNLVVLEFWATWCGPCKVTIPQLNQLYQRFHPKGVQVVAITDEPASIVRAYVTKMGTNMVFPVATDLDSNTSKAYLGAFGIRGVPHAFVIDGAGKVVWQGHPLNGLEQAVDDLLKGTFNPERAKLAGEFTQDVQRYLVMTSTAGATPESARLGRKILSEAQGQPELLQRFAMMILTDGRIRGRDLPLALEAASQANLGTGGKQTAYLETYARALFDSGKQDEAILMQRQAIAAAGSDQVRAAAQRALEDYQKRLAAVR